MRRKILNRRLHAGHVVACIRGLHKNLSDLSLMARGGDMLFQKHLSLPGATFSSLWHTCMMAFWRIDSVVMSLDIVKS